MSESDRVYKKIRKAGKTMSDRSLVEEIWTELDLDRWTWKLPRSTSGPYVAEHIPKPLIVEWLKKWKPIIDAALMEYQERDALVKLQKIKAIVTTYGPVSENMISEIEDIVDSSVDRELREAKRLKQSLLMIIVDIVKWHKAQLGNQVDPTDIKELGNILETIPESMKTSVKFWGG